MDFWLISALLTFAATLAVLLPLMRRNRILSPSMHNDLAVYRDQLREVEADAARGMIDAESAEQARMEISRRILNAEKAAIEAQENAARKGSSRLVAFVAVLSVPLIAWGLYPLYGRPDMPSQPLQARLAESPDRNSVAELIARAERHLAQNPDDARGWDVLAPIYLRLGRNGDAVNAYRTAIRLAGENAQRLLGLGEALTVVAGGTVTAEAEAAFEKAAQLAPDDLVASYYLAQRDLQDGKPEAAIARLHTAGWRDTYSNVLSSDFLKNAAQEEHRIHWQAVFSKSENNKVVFVAEEAMGRLISLTPTGLPRFRRSAFLL